MPASRTPLRAARAFVACAALFFVAGCSTYATESLRIRSHVDEGDLAGALAEVRENAGDEPDVLSRMQEGLIAYYAGEYEASVAAFQDAAVRIDEQFTKSVSTEALAFLSNDQSRPYDGYPGEQALLHIYTALAYLALGEREAALVETRAASTQLERLEAVREEATGYRRDPFAEWIAAMLYAEDDDANACLVSCRRALSAYEEALEAWDMPIPENFLDDYARWATRFGFLDERAELEERFGERGPLASPLSRDEGEVVLIYESGWVDHLVQQEVSFPILGTDRYDDYDAWATAVAVRGPRGVYVAPSGVEVKYWLRVAWPALEYSGFELVQARMSCGGVEVQSEPAQDVSAIFTLTFEEGQGARVARTLARALAKYAAVRALDHDEDTGRQVLSFMANIVAAGTEVADTRSWTMLPDQIHVARLRLPEGAHDVDVEILDQFGRIGQRLSFDDVRVVAGSRTVIHHRSFR